MLALRNQSSLLCLCKIKSPSLFTTCSFMYCHWREKNKIRHCPDFLVSSCVHSHKSGQICQSASEWMLPSQDVEKCVSHIPRERRITESSEFEPPQLPKCNIYGVWSTEVLPPIEIQSQLGLFFCIMIKRHFDFHYLS